jgi:peptidoglycan hydrolase-like protein with peptidoglycan-binding domain
MAGVSKGADHVTRQFQRVHGPDGPAPDAEGKRRGTLQVPRLRRRPGDDRLKQPVGRDAPNRPDDVARLQRALSETGDYTFTAPRERSGVMNANLDTAVTRYQRRNGLKPDGVVTPDGPTIQQIAAEAEANKGGQLRETAESEKPVNSAPTVERPSSTPSEGIASDREATETNRQPAESKACQQAKKRLLQRAG